MIRKRLCFWRRDDKQKQFLGRAKLRGQALRGSPCSPHRSPPAPPGPTPPHTPPNLPKLPQKEGKEEGGPVPLSQVISRTPMPENPPGNTVRTPRRQLPPRQRGLSSIYTFTIPRRGVVRASSLIPSLSSSSVFVIIILKNELACIIPGLPQGLWRSAQPLPSPILCPAGPRGASSPAAPQTVMGRLTHRHPGLRSATSTEVSSLPCQLQAGIHPPLVPTH